MADSEDAEKIDDFLIETLRTASAKNSNPIITAIQSLERKTFPSSESLTIQTEISKRNTYILVARLPGSTVPVIGYLIYINTFAGLRIHKVCVGEKFRRRGVAKKLIQCVCDTAKKTGKDIDLWVDENRIGAIQCYTTCGFRQVADVVVDYYGPARNGIRMIWSPE